MHRLTVECSGELAKDMLLAEWEERGTLGVTEHELPEGRWLLEGFFAGRFAAPEGDWSSVREDETASAPFEAACIGERFFLAPPGNAEPTPAGRHRITGYARQASGSGYQPATRLALIGIERHLRPADRFVDVGTGSGILCQAAAAIGAHFCIGCDVDPVALAEARENGAPAHLFAGSVRALRTGSADFIAANLNAESLLMLGEDLTRVLAPNGRLMISGFTQRNQARLEKGFVLQVRERLEEANWRSIVFGR